MTQPFNPADALMGYIKALLWRRNKSFNTLFRGDLGAGKSYSAMTLALIIQKDWTPKKGLVFYPSDFIARLRSPELKRGDALIWDEAGVGMSSRSWQSTENRITGSVLQTMRTKNILLITTTPEQSFIDVQMRRLFNAVAEPVGINYKNNTCKVKFLFSKTNKKTGKVYEKFPRIRHPDGSLKRMPYINFHKPPEKICKAYDKMRDAFTDALNERNERILRGLEDRGQDRKDSKREARKMFRKGYTTKEIAQEFNVSDRSVRKWVEDMRN